jgi:hypothetical protein
MRNPTALACIVCVLSMLITYLADPCGLKQSAKVFVVSVVVLAALMGLGAVFGKTLGDFLRNANSDRPRVAAVAIDGIIAAVSAARWL